MSAAEYVSLVEAAKLVPSPKPGKRTHVNTVRRWCRSGRVRSYRRGRWLFVKVEDLLAAATPQEVTPQPAEGKPRSRAQQASAEERQRKAWERLRAQGV